jgi:cellulose synthase/poly-beta-1,6-N-acetylglucosamine synthase-like glycosyltransferase
LIVLLESVFWLSCFAILYAYIGYPSALWLLSQMSRSADGCKILESDRFPTVSIVIAAYNEESVISEKIANTLSLDFPQELLEIVVLSDGSSDNTCARVSEFKQQGVVLRHFDKRLGKTTCLNMAVPLAAGEIIVFSDANSLYEKSALIHLLRPFKDCGVGFVTGWTKYVAGIDELETSSLSLYARLELLTKVLESRLGTCIGADGAIFAIRKKLYVPLKDYDINDFVIPLSINEQGYRGVVQRDAFCIERDAGGAAGEFKRQVRITSRTIRAIMNYRRLLNPFKYGWYSVELFSHKLCKFLVPFFLLVMLVVNIFLYDRSVFFLTTLAGQLLLYVGAGVGFWITGAGFVSRMADAAKTFVMVNAAIAVAWIKYAQGESFTIWAPTKR